MLEIQINNESTFETDTKPIIDLVEFTCKKHEIAEADISIAIVDDQAMSKVHEEFMNDASTTDVMSFNLSDSDKTRQTFEMIVNADMACRIAKSRNTPPLSELLLYILHGLLHNIGFNDLCEGDFNEMHKAENEILEELGYGRVFGNGKFGEKI